MKTGDEISCSGFPCQDIDKHSHIIPSVEIDTGKIRVLMITEAPPGERADYFYSAGNPFFLQTTLQAFNDAGVDVSSMQNILDLGVYITTAIKCGKAQYTISRETMKNC
jgi:hypothetical protein